jgi:folate-dependent phosphoribosylglycinamide formyltransferase PurN
VAGAFCLKRAETYKIMDYTIDRESFKQLCETPTNSLICFKEKMLEKFKQVGPDFIFTVGCKHFVPVVKQFPVFNIHPADKEKHGGFEMMGLKPHIHVLEEIIDQIKRKKADIGDRFFTYPTIHEIPLSATEDVSKKYDGGAEILRGQVEIPTQIINKCFKKIITIEEAAEALQQHVLPFEWQMLPTGVMMAAQKIFLNRGGITLV